MPGPNARPSGKQTGGGSILFLGNILSWRIGS